MVSTSPQFVNSWSTNAQYFDMLRLMASLSKLFSENSIPYLDYRLTENLFCKYFNAINDARSCTAYDARIGTLGIGIKTFGITSGASTEKIAEFNRLKPQLDPYHGDELALRLAQFRNDRIDLADNTYGVTDSIYHIVGRVDGALRVFNTPYKRIDASRIRNVSDNATSLSFQVDDDFYTFNKSKSVLMKRFVLPEEHTDVDVDILDDPLELLASLLGNQTTAPQQATPQQAQQFQNLVRYQPRIKGVDYVVLPLYSTRGHIAHVPEKSGLNQWNAGGRPRDVNEVYIPVPISLRNNYPHFFPGRDVNFVLVLPNGDELSAKICQDGGKALMSNPNSALGEWLLRRVLRKRPGELVTMNDLVRFGIDSVLIQKTHTRNNIGQEIYKISFTVADYESYQDFIGEEV